jgi:leucyl aminopeptidase
LLIIIPKGTTLPRQLIGASILNVVLKRRNMKASELVNQPISAELGQGGLVVWAMLDFSESAFIRQSAVRKALQLLLSESPSTIDIACSPDKSNWLMENH